MLPEQQQRILGYFIEEARDHLNTIEQGLLNLQATLNDQEMINEVFRAAHSIKGGAAMLGLSSIQRTSHRLEDCFKILKDNPIQVDQKLESLFLGVSDTLKVLLEHLSGPFGLSEEAAKNLMSEAEPVFGWLYEHLELLVGKQVGIVKIEKEPEQLQQVASTSNYPIAESDNSGQVVDMQYFQNQVLHKLRDMLQLFKQPATPESRQSLSACCETLALIGEELGLSNWCKLCRATGSAILLWRHDANANPDNSYLTLAKIVITDIKRAQELAISLRDAEIAISHQLEALLDVPEIELFEFDNDFLDEIAIYENQDEYNYQLENNFNFTDNNFDIEADNNINSLLELTEIHTLSIEDEDDNINSLFELSNKVSTVEASNVTADNINSLSELSDQLDEIDDISVAQTDITLDPNGPEVGIAELTELDELFKIDAPELADTWEEKHPDKITGEDVNTEDTNTHEENDDSLVHDLLEFEDSTSFHERQAINPQELTIVQLFGDFLDDENLEVEQTPVQQAESNGVGTILPNNLFTDVDTNTLDNDILDIDTITPIDEDAHLDSLFLSTENSVDILLVEEEPEEIIIALETSTPIPEYLTFDDSSSADDVTSVNLVSAYDDLFGTSPATSLSQSTDDFNDFWIQSESEHEKIELEVNENIAQALEESLFAAASKNNIFDTSQETVLEANDTFENALDINFQQQEQIDSMFDLGDEDDLFNSTSTNDSGFSQLNDDSSPLLVEHSNELASYSQQVEVPEFTPESLPNQSLEAQTNNLPQLKLGEEIELSEVEVGDDTLQMPFDEIQDAIADDVLFPTTDNDTNNPFIGNDLFADIPQLAAPATGLDFIDDLFGENTILAVDADEQAPLTTPNTELPAFAPTTVQNLDPQFEENFFADGLSIDEIESLGAILEPFEPFEQPTDIPLSEISVNTNLEIPTTNEVEETEDEFAHLEALLNASTNLKSANDLIADNEFAALEALLGDDDKPVPPAQIEPLAEVSTAFSSAIPAMVDEFSDLEKLLVDADISLLPGSGGSSAKNQRSVSRRAARFEQLMKVPVKHLDELSNLVGELVVNRNTLEQDQERLRQSLDNLLIQVHHLSDVGARMQELYERSLLEASLLASRKGGYGGGSSGGGYSGGSDSDRGFSELEMDRFTPFHSLSQEMIELIVRVRESASDIDFVTEETERVARQFRQVTTQLQEGLTRARMVPFSQVTDRVKRGVRDNAIKCGKQVELEIEGQDTLIDKMILEHLTDPLVHMLNNAIAHGIEMPEERHAKGKQPVGTITVRAFHQGNQTVISVSDDGAGIDHERVKQKALKVGLISPEQAQAMSRIEIYELLFLPNFSTKDKADDLAGRGVGMDVVRTSISEIRGTITTDSKLGKGTNFTIRLPLTLSICKALCCVSDKARIAFPMDGVEDTLDIPVKNVLKSEGESFISWRDTLLPFKPLKDLLTLNRQLSRGSVYGGNRDDDMVSVVVVRSGNTLIALQVDQVLSEQEIVIKQFEGPAPKPIGVAGATVLGDGRIMPIADVLEIIDVFQGRTSKQSAVTIFDSPNNSADSTAGKIDPTVLIVDDSITVRELLSLTFNKAGYRVEQARDGQEAWDKLRSGLPCDIVFCDIEMPRCDGLELLSRISKEPSLNHLPIAMLTSRGADKHKQMAINLGASGYFTKPYLEEALLEAAGRMLKGEKLVSNATTST